ncbi:hypothetical protein ACFLUO_05155 [Chloroflexota bacterium]
MIRLERFEVLQRIMRQDDVTELSIPTWDLVSEAIKAGKAEEALEYHEYSRSESERNNNTLVSFIEGGLTYLANCFGEEEVEKVLRQRYYPVVQEWLEATPGVEETLLRSTESQRGHHANFTVKEEPDRYVVTYDPCGTGGRLRRTRSVGTTKKVYPWAWNESGVPYYCCHCFLKWEKFPIELRGYPLRINLRGAKPEDPCVHVFYKKPELIPEEYFTRIGMTKTIK